MNLSAIPFTSPPVTWNNGRRDVALGVVPIGWLKPADYNPREMSDEARERLEHGLDAFGVIDTLVATEDGTLLGGHQRLVSERRRGAAEVPVYVVFGLDPAEQAAANVLLNNPNAQGQWDMAKLTALLSELDGAGFDATLTGFNEAELEKLLAPAGDLTGDTDALDPGEDRYREQYGVIVLVGSATEQEAVYERLKREGFSCKVVTT